MNPYQDEDLYVSEQTRLVNAASAQAAASIEAGHPFSLLLAEDDSQREEALEAVMGAVAGPGTRLARVRNPLRARLTLERLLIQVVPRGTEIRDEAPAAIIRHIAERRADETRVLLIIERAETLHPDVVGFLGQAAAYFPDANPVLQVLFVGQPEFQQLLASPDAGLEEQTVLLEQYRSSEPGPPASGPPTSGPPTSGPPTSGPPASGSPPVTPEPERQQPVPAQQGGLRAQLAATWHRSVPNRLLMILGPLICLAALAVGVVVAVSVPHDVVQPDAVSPLAEMPVPGQGEPDPPVLRQGPPADQATADLRREFEAYLVAAGKTIDDVPAVQKRIVYNEFLAWRARTTGPAPR